MGDVCFECNRLRRFLEREGYRRCDNPACNCDSYHAHDGWYARFKEIEEVVEPRNGETLLTAVKRRVGDVPFRQFFAAWWEIVSKDADSSQGQLDALWDAADRLELVEDDENIGGHLTPLGEEAVDG